MRHITPEFRLFSGDDSLNSLGRELERAGASRAVVVCGNSLARSGAELAIVEDAIGPRLAGRWNGTRADSPLPSVLEARDELRSLGADAVIAVGGGSALVTARAALILLGEGRDIRDLCTRRSPDGRSVSPRLTHPKLPLWAVPTTPTTAIATAGCAVLDPSSGERLALFDPKARARGAFFDPRLAVTAPMELVRGAALNALSMSIEGLQSGSDDAIAHALLLHCLRLISEWLPSACARPRDPEPRVRLMLAALLCSQGIENVGGGIAQALSHAAGPRSSAPNGVVEALLLPHVMRYNEQEVGSALHEIARVLTDGKNPDDLEAAIEAVRRILISSGAPQRLRNVGLDRGQFAEIVEHAADDWALTRIPRSAGRDELMELLRSAW